MAVNNFAPAEYGGYVLGANSGGGGGGSSVFDEQYGVAGWYDVEITFQAPEGSRDSLEEASVAITILIVGANDRDLLKIITPVELNTMLISDNKYVLHVPYLTGDDNTSYFNVTGVNGENYYVTDGSSATCTGDVEYDSYIQAIKVTGDGSVTAPLDYSD